MGWGTPGGISAAEGWARRLREQDPTFTALFILKFRKFDEKVPAQPPDTTSCLHEVTSRMHLAPSWSARGVTEVSFSERCTDPIAWHGQRVSMHETTARVVSGCRNGQEQDEASLTRQWVHTGCRGAL